MTPALIAISLNVKAADYLCGETSFTWSQGGFGNRKCWSPLTWMVQVYSESSSSLTVQLHSLSRLLMLLLMSRLSIFSIVCVRDQGEGHTAHTCKFIFSHVNVVPVLWSNTWSATVRSGGGASFYQCVSAVWPRHHTVRFFSQSGVEMLLLLLLSLWPG